MTLRAILVLVLTVAFAAAPAFVPFDGFDPNRYPIPQVNPPVQPAGYAFGIWGLIYAWLAAMALWGVWKHADDPAWDGTRPGLILSLAAGVPWLSVAQVSPVWSTLLIWVMLAGALWALVRAPHGQEWVLGGPIGLYAGWLTAASCVALGLFLAGWGVPPFGETGWAIVCLVIALSITLAVQRMRYSLTLSIAVVWALVGVVVANGSTIVGLCAGAGAVGLALLTLFKRFRIA
jgi:hypothetical protein